MKHPRRMTSILARLGRLFCVAACRPAFAAEPAQAPALPREEGVASAALPSEAEWDRCVKVELDIPLNRTRDGAKLEEKGSARFLRDDTFFYVRFDLEDADIVALGDRDGLKHYVLGDVAEVFLWPEDETWYGEVHLTPAGKVTTYWYAGRGRLGLPEDAAPLAPSDIVSQARVRGTLNDWKDRDAGWTAILAIPWAKISPDGRPSGGRWRVLVARYNFGRYRTGGSGPELSSWPPVSAPNFHLLEEFARLGGVRD